MNYEILRKEYVFCENLKSEIPCPNAPQDMVYFVVHILMSFSGIEYDTRSLIDYTFFRTIILQAVKTEAWTHFGDRLSEKK